MQAAPSSIGATPKLTTSYAHERTHETARCFDALQISLYCCGASLGIVRHTAYATNIIACTVQHLVLCFLGLEQLGTVAAKMLCANGARIIVPCSNTCSCSTTFLEPD